MIKRVDRRMVKSEVRTRKKRFVKLGLVGALLFWLSIGVGHAEQILIKNGRSVLIRQSSNGYRDCTNRAIDVSGGALVDTPLKCNRRGYLLQTPEPLASPSPTPRPRTVPPPLIRR